MILRSWLATLALLALVACTGAAPPATPSPTPAPTRVVLVASYSNLSTSNLVLWTAKEAGLFEGAGLDVDVRLIEGGQTTMAALVAGQTDFAHLGGSEVLSAAVGGAELAVVATLVPLWAFVLMAPPDIKTPAELKGKKLGIATVGGSVDIAARVALPKVGLVPDKDVTFIPTGSTANLTAALIAGSVQAGMVQPPDTVTLEARGFRVLVDLAKLDAPTSTNVAVARRQLLSGRRDVAQRYVDALVRATVRAKSDRAFAIGVLRKYLKLDDEKVAAATYDHFIKLSPTLPEPKAEQFADAVEQLSRTNAKVKTFDVAAMLDASFVRDAAARGVDKQ